MCGFTGFTNIKCEPKRDLLVGLINKEGEVDEIIVNGKKKFNKKDRYRPDTEIIIKWGNVLFLSSLSKIILCILLIPIDVFISSSQAGKQTLSQVSEIMNIKLEYFKSQMNF